jgi:hypothetical protein
MSWYYRSPTKSMDDLQHLVDDVLLADDFDVGDLQDFNAKRELERMDEPTAFSEGDGWKQASVSLPVPAEGVPQSETSAAKIVIGPIWYRTLCSIIRAALREDLGKSFHIIPFKQFWIPEDGSPPERVFSETYTADAQNQLYEELGAKPEVLSSNLEVMVLVLMLWSDSTHLANFGTASLWPIYLFFGNLSKYIRCKPSSFAAHHLAYIPSVRVPLRASSSRLP